MIDAAFLEMLVCPKCRSALSGGETDLACTGADCGLVYPIRDGIPVLLVDEGIKRG